jgi:DNA-directed RNA polymerase specialized sigma24 family protein
MEHLRRFRLLDEQGHPLSARIESALSGLVPRFRKDYPALQNEDDLAAVFEQAGRKIARREQERGSIERLHGYAWVTLRSIAASWLRRGSGRLTQHTLPSEEGEAALASLPAAIGTADQIENDIFLREVEPYLSRHERLVLGWKKAGFTSEEIAHFRGTSVGAVDAVFSRAKHKIRTLLRVQEYGGSRSRHTDKVDDRLKYHLSEDKANVERRDDDKTPASGQFRLQVRR